MDSFKLFYIICLVFRETASINFEEQYIRVLLFSVIFDLIIPMLPIANMYLIYRLKHGYGFCKNINPIVSSKWFIYKMEKNQIWKIGENQTKKKKSGCFWPLLVWRGGYGVPRPVAPRDSALAAAIIITVLGFVPHFLVSSSWRLGHNWPSQW